jgi:hypothetical protein
MGRIHPKSGKFKFGAGRARLDRLLDPDNGNATIESLQRAARIVGRELDGGGLAPDAKRTSFERYFSSLSCSSQNRTVRSAVSFDSLA